MKDTAKFIKSIRKTMGLTQREFAGLLGTNRSAIANYETRVNAPGDFMMKAFNLYQKIKDMDPKELKWDS